MKKAETKSRLPFLVIAGVLLQVVSADTIITTDGDELTGNVTRVTDREVRYIPEGTVDGTVTSLPAANVFMVKYDDGRKKVFGTGESTRPSPKATDDGRVYSGYVFCETGLFGLVNINEEHFDPGVFTIGVTPSVDRKLNRYLSVGVEWMILWAKAKQADDSRFIMNGNACARLSFQLHPKINFLAQLGAGLSIWPGSENTYPADTTFFKDRIGWDLHGGLGLEHRTFRFGSIVLFAGYNANVSMLHDIPVTIDMLIISLGPKISF